jgi:AraC-like DNA-binding protein
MTDKEISDQVIQVVLNMPDRELGGLSVTKLARILEVDRFRLSRQFKRQKDMTLECFLFKEKMTRAAFLLMGRSTAVKEVARRLGFCTCDYFIRKFREYYGIVPGQFKEFRMQRSEGEGRSKQEIGNAKSCETCFYRLAYLYKEMAKGREARNLKNE